jgi:hypothetical protein
MFWNKQKGQVRADEKCADALFVVLTDNLKKDGRIRAEDVIAAAASITGERCIEAAGNFNSRKHNFVPGSRVFSDKVNELISGDSAGNDLDAVPAESIIGILRDRLLPSGYAKSDFSPLTVIFEHFAANVGRPSEWGEFLYRCRRETGRLFYRCASTTKHVPLLIAYSSLCQIHAKG